MKNADVSIPREDAIAMLDTLVMLSHYDDTKAKCGSAHVRKLEQQAAALSEKLLEKVFD